MNGHKLSSTRQWNRHWQNGEDGGLYPPVPVYPSFANFNANMIFFETQYVVQSSSGVNIDDITNGMACFLNENRIYFDYFNMGLFNSNRMLIPAHIELQLKDKFYLNTDDLFNQFPNGFHHINMIKTTFTFFGEDIDYYELTFDTNYNYDERYIEYDFTRASINKIQLNAYVMNAVGGEDTRTYFDTWQLIGHPTPDPNDLANANSNINFVKNINGLVVRKTGHPIFPNVMTGMYIPPYEMSSMGLVTYDLNNLYDRSGGLNYNSTLIGNVFFRGNSLSVEAEGTPIFSRIYVYASSFPIRYYDEGYIYYSKYENVNITQLNTAMTYFDLTSDYDDATLSKIRIYTNY